MCQTRQIQQEKNYAKVKMITKQLVFFYGLYIAPKIKYCLTIDVYGIIQEHKICKSFIDRKRLLDRSQYFNMIEGKKISAMLPKSWKKLFNNGITIPTE